ncbi:hypothetical protein LZ554_001510 [Drepanopeziza brunnea f. sp. 'monogermtubi']|nr:hypothetical protein LZ554_001510 [Drepanopeziza brunnea f. sp. 'monogermtubi']
MPSIFGQISAERAGSQTLVEISKRINIPLTATSPPGLIEANTVDPFNKSGKYGLGWTYFCLVLVVLHEVEQHMVTYSPDSDYAMGNIVTGGTGQQLFPRENDEKSFVLTRGQSHWSSIGFVNDTLALFRWVFYRPVPEIIWKKRRILSFPSLAVIAILVIATAFVTLYCFLPQPLYWQSIRYGSPPLAVRAGMIAIAMTPWIVATSMKANLITIVTGISHERLGVFHRWGGYLCLFLSLVHTVPFYIQPVWEDGGMTVFAKLFPPGSGIIYGSGIACLVPLGWLCIVSLPFIRSVAYELFIMLHIPAAAIYVGMLFWHCRNYLLSRNYLYATVAIWAFSYFVRLFSLNWMKPWRNAWLIGDEAAVTLMAENAIKVTIPTQMTWRPGQYVYLRMPGISVFENHPFTISSLCSEDFPSEYGDLYRDCTLVFRPFGGFTRRVLETAIEKGPFKTYRAYLEGPYGGMQRELAAFDTVIFFAGGSGITAIVSQLLNLIKRMRDGKAVTRKIEVVWALKRLESMDWFREELRICREYAPPDSVTCQFYVTSAKRQPRIGVSERAPRPISTVFHDKLDGFVAGIASKRNSQFIRDEAQGDEDRERELRQEDEDAITSLPHPKYLQHKVLTPPLPPRVFFPPPPQKAFRENATEKPEGKEKEKASIETDSHEATRNFLSHNRLSSISTGSYSPANYPPPPPGPPPNVHNRPASYTSSNSNSPPQSYNIPSEPFPPSQSAFAPPPLNPEPTPPAAAHTRPHPSDLHIQIPSSHSQSQSQTVSASFGFPSTPTEFQKNLMRFAFVGAKKKEGWSTDYGRPELGYMLKEMATGGADGKGIFGRRTCVFVCGPPSMRVDVANTVARLQADIWGDDSKDEIFLHTENYAI